MIATLLSLLALINAPYSPVSYACDGVTAAYTVTFPYLQTADILATSTTSGGAITTLVITTDYTLNLSSTSSTATLTLTNPAVKCPSGNTLKIARVVTLTQPYSFKNQTTFNQTLHETAYDRIEMQVQQTDSKITSGTVLLQATTPGSQQIGNVNVSGTVKTGPVLSTGTATSVSTFNGTSNGAGLAANGGASGGYGVSATGGGTGGGINAAGGSSSSPPGVLASGGSPNGNGVQATGSGTGSGVTGTGGASGGNGVQGTGTGTGAGGSFTAGATGAGGNFFGGATSGNGINSTGGATSSTGVQGTGGTTNGVGVNGQGTGTGTGVVGVGGGSSGGQGGTFTGGAVQGRGLTATATGTAAGIFSTGSDDGAGIQATGGSGGGGPGGVFISGLGNSPARGQINLTPTTNAPSAPNNGDLWTTSTGLFARINGGTVGPFAAGTKGAFNFINSGTSLTSGTTYYFSTSGGAPTSSAPVDPPAATSLQAIMLMPFNGTLGNIYCWTNNGGLTTVTIKIWKNGATVLTDSGWPASTLSYNTTASAVSYSAGDRLWFSIAETAITGVVSFTCALQY